MNNNGNIILQSFPDNPFLIIKQTAQNKEINKTCLKSQENYHYLSN